MTRRPRRCRRHPSRSGTGWRVSSARCTIAHSCRPKQPNVGGRAAVARSRSRVVPTRPRRRSRSSALPGLRPPRLPVEQLGGGEGVVGEQEVVDGVLLARAPAGQVRLDVRREPGAVRRRALVGRAALLVGRAALPRRSSLSRPSPCLILRRRRPHRRARPASPPPAGRSGSSSGPPRPGRPGRARRAVGRPGQVRLAHGSAVQPGLGEHRAGEVGHRQVGVAEVDAAQVDPGQVVPTQADPDPRTCRPP